MPRIIESVEVIHQHQDGPDVYKVGRTLYQGEKIADIIENEGTFQFFNEKHEQVMEIRNAPVVVRYREIEESDDEDDQTMDDKTEQRWKAAIDNARFLLEEYKKFPAGIFGAMNISNAISRYDNGERTEYLLEELESIR